MRTNCVVFSSALAVFLQATANAGLIMRDSFRLGDGAWPSSLQYRTGDLTGTTPQGTPVHGFSTPWLGSTGTIDVVGTGLSYTGFSNQGGMIRFRHTAVLTDLKSDKRLFTSDYDLNRGVYYLSGLMSFDESFQTANDATAFTGVLNTEDTYDNWTTTPDPGSGSGLRLGVQWGFQGNGTGGVDAVVRVRDRLTGDIVNRVVASDVSPGTHLFMMKVQPNISGSDDRLTVWFDAANPASEATAGPPALADNFSFWVPGGSDPGRIVDTLVFNARNVGANTAVGYDEVRFGESWDDLALANESNRTFRQGVDGYTHLGAELRERNTSYNGSSAGVLLTGADNSGGTVGKLRTVLGFDLSDIPADAQITEAWLIMNAESVDLRGDGLKEIELRCIDHDGVTMSEAEVSWSRLRTGEAWTTPGGDYTTLLSSISGFDDTDLGEKIFSSTAAFVAAVEDALRRNKPLEMILLSPETELDTLRNFVRWSSDDASNPALRPMLAISYNYTVPVPEPSTAGLGILAGFVFLVGRKQWRAR